MITEEQFKDWVKRLKEKLDNPSHEVNCSINVIWEIIDNLSIKQDDEGK